MFKLHHNKAVFENWTHSYTLEFVDANILLFHQLSLSPNRNHSFNSENPFGQKLATGLHHSVIYFHAFDSFSLQIFAALQLFHSGRARSLDQSKECPVITMPRYNAIPLCTAILPSL